MQFLESTLFTIFVYFSISCDFTNFLRHYISILNPLWLPLSPPESWARTTSKEVKGQGMFAWSKTKNVCGHQTIKEWYYYFQCWRNVFFDITLQGTSSFLKNATLIYVGNFFARSIYRSISLTIEVSTYVSNVTSIVTKSNLFWIVL